MAQQQFFQPKPQRKRDSEEQEKEIEEQQSQPSSVNEQSAQVSQQAEDSLGNIDDVLADYEANPAEKVQDENTSLGDLRQKEESPEAPSQGFTPDPYIFRQRESAQDRAKGKVKTKKEGRFKGGVNRAFNRKQLFGFATGLGVTGLLLGGVFTGGMLFKGNILGDLLNNFTQKLTKKVLDRRSGAYTARWFENDILRATRTCGSTVNLDCMNREQEDAPTGIIGAFILAMRQGRVREQLGAQGINVTYDRNTRTFKIVTKAGNVDVPDNAQAIGNYRIQMIRGRNAALREITRVVDTQFDDRAQKRRITKALKRHYGLKACVVFCNVGDNIQIRRDDIGLRIEGYYNAMAGAVGRVVIDTTDAKKAVLLDCITGKINCTKEGIRRRLIEIDTENSRALANDNRQLDELREEGARRRAIGRSNTVANLAMRSMMSALIGEDRTNAVTRLGTRAIPFVGWVILASAFMATAGKAADLVQDKNGTATFVWDSVKKTIAIGSYNIINSGGNENTGANSKGGYDLTAMAAFNNRIDGFATASAFPLIYGSYATASFVNEGQGVNKTCEDHSTGEETHPDGGQAYCNDAKLGTEPPFVVDKDSAAGSIAGIVSILAFPFTIINDAINELTGVLIEILTTVPGVQEALDFVGGLAEQALEWAIGAIGQEQIDRLQELIFDMFNGLVPTCASVVEEAEGACLAQSAMIGADYTNNAYSRGMVNDDGSVEGLGAPPVGDGNLREYVAQIEKEEKEDLKYASMGERFFTVSNPESLLSRFLLVGPASDITSPQRFIASSTNPFASSFGMISNALLNSRLHAQSPEGEFGQYAVLKRGESVTGVAQYGYNPEGDYVTSAPLNLTEEECDKIIKENFKQPENVDYGNDDYFDSSGDIKYQATKEARQCMLDKEVLLQKKALYEGAEL